MSSEHSGKTAEDYEDKYTKPELREELKEKIKAGDKGGKKGQWSARKSQLLVHEYEAGGGGYKDSGHKTEGQKSLEHWTEEEWQTMDGDRAREADGTVKRYLPKKAWDELTDKEKQKTEAKKEKASREGRQFVDNTPAAKEARKDAKAAVKAEGLASKTVAELHEMASDFQIEGRSSMGKAELVHALTQASGASGGSSDDEPTKEELYEKAKAQDVEGRSKMSKSELKEAVDE